ncbi:DUF2524 domain-containing protein [Paenibacillus validus]|uniref:DUF2524 domain-containing protein n=1 Tax=Paenibacillus validus TaxID=44253 RepID=A0A7X2ZB79_9BACL|nr:MULTISPECIES: hypothetical protein [Paenibacillus]MED4601603.1 DUF2524 domain-containing protein [Paenibacillus validus]MED4607611.1 DUF2524 domain-containing protein [Paenibacillus validus]MUG71627.1 DUF2524 domain-containing protein [Paenibacillus validus]
MLNQLESSYNCANAGQDLHELQQELESLQQTSGNPDQETTDTINRLENQIRFIKNKCEIRP